MRFDIVTVEDNGSGMKYFTKQEFMKEISLMVDDCIANGGTRFSVSINANASCFHKDDE